MKKCFKCLVEKPFSEFYKHKAMADGYLGKCKECAKADVKMNYAKNVDHYREYDRSRARDPKRVAARRSYSQTENGSAFAAAARRRYIERNPHKRSAHIAVGSAIKRGRLVPGPCEVCGGNKNIHGHHDDYAFPLVVRWLCAQHHADWHKINKPLFGGYPLED